MRQVGRTILFGCVALVVAALFWAVRVELTFERNLRRGIPADFKLYHRHSVPIWRV